MSTSQSPAFRRSSRCSTGGCVEVAKVDLTRTEKRFLVRDSKDPHSPQLAFDAAAWRGFIESIKSGDLDHR